MNLQPTSLTGIHTGSMPVPAQGKPDPSELLPGDELTVGQRESDPGLIPQGHTTPISLPDLEELIRLKTELEPSRPLSGYERLARELRPQIDAVADAATRPTYGRTDFATGPGKVDFRRLMMSGMDPLGAGLSGDIWMRPTPPPEKPAVVVFAPAVDEGSKPCLLGGFVLTTEALSQADIPFSFVGPGGQLLKSGEQNWTLQDKVGITDDLRAATRDKRKAEDTAGLDVARQLLADAGADKEKVLIWFVNEETPLTSMRRRELEDQGIKVALVSTADTTQDRQAGQLRHQLL